MTEPIVGPGPASYPWVQMVIVMLFCVYGWRRRYKWPAIFDLMWKENRNPWRVIVKRLIFDLVVPVAIGFGIGWLIVKFLF